MPLLSSVITCSNNSSFIHRFRGTPWQKLLRLRGRREHPIRMAYYLVRAKPKAERLLELQEQLQQAIGLLPFGKARLIR